MTQNKQILHYLKTGKSITPLEALYQFGCLRLSARIFELKEKGWPITCDRQDVGDGKVVGYYTLVNNRDLWPIE
jgi:hypothetical protein